MPTSRRPVVLLVQRSRDDGLEMYTEFLRYHGLAVIPVSDSTDALMLAPQADIVVTGRNLDDAMDGVELVSRLRHNDRTRSTPIIVLTACVCPKERARAEGAGCDVFLLKPYLPEDLLSEVRQLLAARCSQTADTPRGFQISSHRAARRAHRVARGSPAVSDEVIVTAKSTNPASTQRCGEVAGAAEPVIRKECKNESHAAECRRAGQ
jgi:DNA-binding response OmpR family regulator